MKPECPAPATSIAFSTFDQTGAVPPEGSPASTACHLQRIEQLDAAGPQLGAVIAAIAPPADPADTKVPSGTLLNGRTVLVKDNIETREWPTTAGSLALAGNATGRDAPLIARLREAGGVVLGKTNLSEWANIRDSHSTSGWSAVGGLARNPHATDRTACGSSSGSGVAVAADFAWAAIGTETDGSVTCPASMNGIVGLKPTLGLVSRTHVIPISHSQDTPGPMAKTVQDAALLLAAIAGSDPLDPATADADAHAMDFTQGLAQASLKGVRLGVLRKRVGDYPQVTRLFDQAVEDMRKAGATIVEIDDASPNALGSDELTVLLYELRVDLSAYLASSPADIPVRSLADVVAFNQAHAERELRWFGQDLMEQALNTTDQAAYEQARADSLYTAGEDGIDRLLADHHVDLLIAPTARPAWMIDLVDGDPSGGGIGAGYLAAIAGYPHLTVPMGAVERLPVGLSFIGSKWSDHQVLLAGAAYEKARSAKLATPSYAAWQAVEKT